MFDIAFIPDEPPYADEEGGPGLWGRTVLGPELAERFVAPVDRWSRADYERQWAAGAARLLAGHSSAFVLEAGRLWWTAWRDGDGVVLQQRLLVAEGMRPAWTAAPDALPYELVGARRPLGPDGEPVSEWRVPLAAVRAFVERRAGGSATAG